MKHRVGQTYIIIRLSALGDVAMTLPLLYGAADDNPDDTFVLVTQSFMSRMVIHPPVNLSTITFSKEDDGSTLGIINYAKKLHLLYPHAIVIDLHSVIRTKAISLAMKAMGHKVVTIDKPRKERRQLMGQRKEAVVSPSLYIPRMTDYYGITLKRAGIKILSKGRLITTRLSSPSQVSIGIAPYAQHQGKMIFKKQVIDIIDGLHERFPDADLILYGAPGTEARKNRELVSLRPDKVRMTSADGIAKEIEEIAGLDCMVSMDSANQHIAAMVGTPVISIWGATHPATGFIPFRTPLANCIGVDMECRPCSTFGDKPCKRGDYACMQNLPISTIIDCIAKEVELRRK